MTILRPILAGLLLTTATAAYAEQVTISAVEVDAELSDVNNKKALEYYPNVREDLQAAISEELFPLTGEDGYTIKVRVAEISLDGVPLNEDKGFNRLGGWVYVYPPEASEQTASEGGTEPAPQEEFNIELEASALGDGLVPGTEEFYRAMIAAFAQSTGERVKEMEAVVN